MTGSGFKDDRQRVREPIAAIEARAVDVVIVRDIERPTRNLTDWDAFEKVRAVTACAVGLYRRGAWTCQRPRVPITAGIDPAGTARKTQ